MHAMVALAPSFDHLHASFAHELHSDREELRLLAGMRLMVALTSDSQVRIASAYHTVRLLGVREDYEAFAGI